MSSLDLVYPQAYDDPAHFGVLSRAGEIGDARALFAEFKIARDD